MKIINTVKCRLGLALLGGSLVLLPPAVHAGLFGPKGDSPEEKRQVVLILLASGRGYGVLKDHKSSKDTFMCVGSLVGGPMEINQFTERGVSLQATVAGTKYWKDSKFNP